MTMIPCGKCGELISDKAKQCPYCGNSQDELDFNQLPYVCEECGEVLPNRLISACPKCGCPIEQIENTEEKSSPAKKLKGLKKKTKIIIAAVAAIVVIALAGIIISQNVLTGDDLVAYNLICDAAYNFKNPTSVRLISGTVGLDDDCLFCCISATNGFGNRTSSYYYISDEGWILEKENPSSFYKDTKSLNIKKINRFLEKKFGKY